MNESVGGVPRCEWSAHAQPSCRVERFLGCRNRINTPLARTSIQPTAPLDPHTPPQPQSTNIMSEVETASGPPRAYAQWVTIKLNNSGSKAVKLTNLDVSWGKLYADGE